MKDLFEQVQRASRSLPLTEESRINETIRAVAEEVHKQSAFLLAENRKDLERMKPDDPKYDRLKLTPSRIEGIVSDMRNLSVLPSPLGRVLKHSVRPNGMVLTRVSVPFGVVGVIYEARPNVTLDVFSLCLKSGNACILKGGSDAECSNRAVVQVVHSVLERMGIDRQAVALLPSGREAAQALMDAVDYVDLLIPRGSSRLIRYVRENAKVPVIETGAGICHTYFDESGDVEKGVRIVLNAKTRRVSVCNALDCLLVHEKRLADLFALCARLAEFDVVIEADERALAALASRYPAALLRPATEESFGTEFLACRMAVKTVSSMEEALEHIRRYGSKHSECIVAESDAAAEAFLKQVDAACVYANVSTAFTDGGQFGMGAEIGISTQKLHARGPMGLEELTSYKWIVKGNGQVRE